MNIILTVLCLIKFRIIYAFALEEGTRHNFRQNRAVQNKRTTTTIEKQHMCEYQRYSTRFSVGPKAATWYDDPKCFVTYRSHNIYDKGCLLIDAGKAAEITCPSDTVIDIFNVMYNYSRCQNDKIYYSDSHYKTHCTKSFECNLPTEPYRQKRASIYFQCRVNKPVDDRTTKSNGGIPVDDKSTKSHVVKPVDVRTTESYVDNMIPGQDSHMESHGIPDYVLIVGGIIGVLLICLIFGVVILRKHKARRPNKKKGITKINITCDITDRQKEPENYERAYLMNSPAALHLATSHEGNLDRTDDNLRSNDVNLCQPQERSIMINDGVLKEDSTTYSHLRKIMDDSDVMYDHTVHIAVHDTCDGDYGVAHRGITEDDYDVSGNYHQSLSNNADPVYN